MIEKKKRIKSDIEGNIEMDTIFEEEKKQNKK